MATGGAVPSIGGLGLRPVLAEHLELEEALFGRALAIEVALLVIFDGHGNVVSAAQGTQ
jgi:hypothetical protein